MNTDRRNRDRIRLFFWAVLAVVCVAAVLVARQQQQQGLVNKAEAAQDRAVRYTDNALIGRIDADRANRPFGGSGYETLLTDVRRELFTDQRVLRLRIWRPDGLLVFTTDDPKEIGKLTSTDEGLRAGFKGEIASVVTTETFAPDLSTTPARTQLLANYVPMRTSEKDRVYAVVEIDNDYGLLREGTSRPWSQMQVAFGIVAILCLAMTVLSFVWSRRPQEFAGFGPSHRDLRAVARDERKVAEAKAEVEATKAEVEATKAEAATLRERVKELEHRPEQPATPEVDPSELERVAARAAQLEEQSRAAEGRTAQLQARVSELEAQLRLTTDQLRAAAKRVEESPEVPTELQAKLHAVEENERRLSTELQLAREEVERTEKARAQAEQDRAEVEQMKQGELDQVRAQVRMAEEERQRILAEAAKSPTAKPVFSPDAQSRIAELEQALQGSETERGMLRSGRPETVYEVRNRELEDELAQVREQLGVAEERARTTDAAKAGVDPGVIAALEARIDAAEERAREAERLLEQAKGRRGSRSRASTRNGQDGGSDADADAAPAASTDDPTATADDDAPAVDGSELRSRLVRSADARRRGVSKTSDRS